MKTIDLGNNETTGRGISANPDGTFTATTYSNSRDFKTHAGAVRWMARLGFNANGGRAQ